MLKTFKKLSTGGIVFFDFFKARNEEKLLKNCFPNVYIKNRFAHFGKIKRIFKNLNFKFSFRGLFGGFLQIFKTILSSLSFFLNENFAARAADIADLRN